MVNDIIRGIIEDNSSFVSTHGEAYFRPHTAAQHPRVTLISCCDSRVQPMVVNADPIDKVFTIETIGNQMASAQGSVDYGVLHLHTPVLLVLGHSDCGAIKAYMKGYDNENDAIKAELDNLRGALPAPGGGITDEQLVKNIRANILHQVGAAVARYRSLVDQGELAVVGAFYDFTNALGKGFGRVIIVTVNGVTGIDKLKAMPELKGLDPDTFVGV